MMKVTQDGCYFASSVLMATEICVHRLGERVLGFWFVGLLFFYSICFFMIEFLLCAQISKLFQSD